MRSVNQVYRQRYACGVRNTKSPYRQVTELLHRVKTYFSLASSPHKSDNNGETIRGRGAVVAGGQGRLGAEKRFMTNTETAVRVEESSRRRLESNAPRSASLVRYREKSTCVNERWR